MMRVSVIIPTFRCPELLRRAIASVVCQTYRDIETIVIDDNGAGTEMQRDTAAIVAESAGIVYVVNQVTLGKAASLNVAIRQAQGTLIAFLDDDDEFHPEKIEKQVARINERGAAGVYCNYRRILRGSIYYQSTHRVGADEGDLSRAMLLCTNEICGGSTLAIRRTVFDEIGGFDERFQRHVDWSFLVKFFRAHELCLCEEPLVTIYMPEQRWKLDPQLLFDTKSLFLSTFQYDIERHGSAARDIYFKHWMDVYFHSLRSMRLGLASRALARAMKQGRVNFPKALRITASALRHAL